MGNLKLALFLAFKSIMKGNRWAFVLIITVMSLSFANLLLTPSILSGVTNTLNQQQIDTLYSNIVVDPPPDEYYLDHASLDVASAKVVLELFKKLNKEMGQTIVMVTHEPEDEKDVDRVVWLKDGPVDKESKY
jgi:ABC-type histidine transport system ATPase subunit